MNHSSSTRSPTDGGQSTYYHSSRDPHGVLYPAEDSLYDSRYRPNHSAHLHQHQPNHSVHHLASTAYQSSNDYHHHTTLPPISNPNRYYSDSPPQHHLSHYSSAGGNIHPAPTSIQLNNDYPSQMDPSPTNTSNPGIYVDPPTAVKKRPKYTRSKAGCLTCRTKKIKCDEVKPVCSRCEHAQRECTWPAEVPRKKTTRPRRASGSPEESGPGPRRNTTSSLQHGYSSNNDRLAAGSAFGSSRPLSPTSAASSASEETSGSTLSNFTEESGVSGSESDADYFGFSSYVPPSSLAMGMQPTQSNMSTQYYSANQFGPGSVHPSFDPLLNGIPLTVSSASPTSFLPPGLSPGALPATSYAYPSSAQAGLYSQPSSSSSAPNLVDRSSSSGYPPSHTPSTNPYTFGDPSLSQIPGVAPTWQSSSFNITVPRMPATSPYPLNLQAAQYISRPTSGQDSDTSSNSGHPHHGLSSPPDIPPSSLPGQAGSYQAPNMDPASVATPYGQWGNTPLVMGAAPDPIEPFFKTLKERSLIRHYANYSTELIMAVNTPAALNPFLASVLPIVLSVLPRQSAPIEALRLSLLGISAIHQSFLHSYSDSTRAFSNCGALATSPPPQPMMAPTPAREKSDEMMRLALLLRQNATQCLAYACQTPDGSRSDAALAASVSVALIDIFAGGQGFQSNLMLAKTLVDIRGGPDNMLNTHPPGRTSFGSGMTVSTARLLLETLAVYDTFGSLTSGEEPSFLGSGHPNWWFDEDEWSYHRFSVEKVFAMSRQCIYLIAKTSALLSRYRSLGEDDKLSEQRPADGTVSLAALALYEEARALLAELEETARTDPAARRFIELASDNDDVVVPPVIKQEETPSPEISKRGSPSPSKSQTSRRIEHGTQVHMMAFQIVLLRLVFHVDRQDHRIRELIGKILERCLESANHMKTPIDLTWPVIIAGCEAEGNQRQMVTQILDVFRQKCCFDIDTAEQIVTEVWRRTDEHHARPDWRSVLEDQGVKVLLI